MIGRLPALLHEAEAFSHFYQRTHQMVYRFIYGMRGGPAQEVEDLTAEVFLRAWKARKSFSGTEGAAEGWIVRIARNLVIDAYRKRKNNPVQELPDEMEIVSPQVSPEDRLISGEQNRKLLRILFTLPLERREMLILRYVLDWSVNQIAEHLGMLENTVSVSLRRTLEHMREEWPDVEQEFTDGLSKT